MTSNLTSQVLQCKVLLHFQSIFDVMAELSTSFLRIEDSENLCLLCLHPLKVNDTIRSFNEKGWETLLKNAEKWIDVNIPSNHEFFLFTTAFDTLSKRNRTGKCHERCRVTLATKCNQFINRFGKKRDEKINVCGNQADEDEKPQILVNDTRQTNPLSTGICFVCCQERPCDSNAYNAGGLGRLSHSAKCVDKLTARTNEYCSNQHHPLHAAACRFSTQWAWMKSSELNTREIYFHQSCYIRYVEKKLSSLGKSRGMRKKPHGKNKSHRGRWK